MKSVLIGVLSGLAAGAVLLLSTPCPAPSDQPAVFEITPEVATDLAFSVEGACDQVQDDLIETDIEREIGFLFSKVAGGAVTMTVADAVVQFDSTVGDINRSYACDCATSCDSSNCEIQTRQGGEVLDCVGSCEGYGCGECAWLDPSEQDGGEPTSLLEDLWSDR